MTAILHSGDCREVMRTFDAESVDAIVCDPPYMLTSGKKGGSGLASVDLDSPYGRARVTAGNGAGGFMGKKWDAPDEDTPLGCQHWHESWAREALRVLKPGAHLVAFGGTRTHHRLMCALEDAGFEIRDTIGYGHSPVLAYCYGSGFPKSRNVSKDERFCQCVPDMPTPNSIGEPTEDMFRRVQGEAHQPVLQGEGGAESQAVDSGYVQDVRGCVRETSVLGEENEGALLLQELQRKRASEDARAALGQYEGSQAEGRPIRTGEPGLEGRRDLFSQARELQANQIREMPSRVHGDGEERRLRDGTSAHCGEDSGSLLESDGSRASSGPQPSEQRSNEPPVVPKQSGAQACGRCGKPRIAPGLGTALKPAWEPIVLARKPLAGTVAQTVARYGTGALNIDACRIPHGEPEKRTTRTVGKFAGVTYAKDAYSVNMDGGVLASASPTGRWPSNCVLGHTPLCGDTCVESCPVRLLDERAGERKSGAIRAGQPNGTNFRQSHVRTAQYDIPADGGNASRFFLNVAPDPLEAIDLPAFYCAKSSRRERNAGLDGMPERVASVGDRDEATGRDSTKPGNAMPGGARDRVLRGESPTLPRANHHPCVKPVMLMRWLCRLVGPPGGTILDPFAGSGSTGLAAILEGFDFIGIESDPEYIEIARRRIAHVEKHGENWLKAAASADDEPDPAAAADLTGLPLFAGLEP